METLSKEKRQFIIVYCTATTWPSIIALRKKLVGNWSLEKLNSRALGGDVLNEFGTFWLAYKEGSILSGRRTKDSSDLAAWLREKYPELRQKLLEPLYDEILKEEERKKWWRMVGDEAGHEGELRYIWVVVPPTSNLKSFIDSGRNGKGLFLIGGRATGISSLNDITSANIGGV